MPEDLRPTPISPEDADNLRCTMVVLFEHPGQDDEVHEFRGILRWTGSELLFSHAKGEFTVPNQAASRLRRVHPSAEAAKDADVLLVMSGFDGPPPEGFA